MERYYKRKSDKSPASIGITSDVEKKMKMDINVAELPNIRDQVLRAYMQRGPCQPRNHKFPLTPFGKQQKEFNTAWFDEHPNWLEYSIAKDDAFCLCCYLFQPNLGEQAGGDSFVGTGFTNFKKKDRLHLHVGGPYSSHNQAWKMCEALMNQNQHLESFFSRQSDQARNEYRRRLTASIDCIRYLLRQGLTFCGDDEFENSKNQGNFLELLKFLADQNDDVKAVTLKNAPDNLNLTSSDIQKDIVNAVATETINVIMKDLGNRLFSILVDESRDISMKEQMVIVLRYVDENGCVIERFVGIEHVANTTALSLKEAIDRLFSRHGLSVSRLRGQGYDGASYMQGEFNGLKTLILKENPSAYYVHCFAHQLQLALVAVAKKHIQVESLSSIVGWVTNIVGAL